MAKAMGLNTVCAYLFWNLHEPTPRRIRLERPGRHRRILPHRTSRKVSGSSSVPAPTPAPNGKWAACPGGCSKTTTSNSARRDPRYHDAAKAYFKEVGRVLGPLQITHGGPIIMAQVENEYGFYGKDAEYVDDMRQALVDAGFDVPLFDCNPPDMMRNGCRTNLFQAGNFGSDPANNFAKLRQIQPPAR